MKRLAVAAAVALIGLCSAHAAPSIYGAPYIRVQDSAPPNDRWNDPANTFSFVRLKGWDTIDTASPPLAPVLQIVASSKGGECWFSRIPREKTASMAPADLIAARSKPLDNAIWVKIATAQQLVGRTATIVEAQVDTIGGWPVQTAWLRGANGDVYAALHSRPGVDIWAFCAPTDGKERSAELLQIARSVATPRDAAWARLIPSQANLTAVP